MKTVHFASILVLTVATAFACNDDGDRIEGGNAGSAGKNAAAGSAGKPNVAGSGNNGAGAGAGGDAGAANDGGAGGNAGSNDGGVAGVGGSNEGGAAGGGVGGETSDAGAAGTGFGGGGGAGGDGNVVQAPLELIGEWDNNFDGEDIITATEWSSFGFPATIAKYDNDANVVYTESGGTFSKVVYTEIQNDSFFYCTIDYGKATLADALASTKVADASNPAASGCGTFSWTKNTRQ